VLPPWRAVDPHSTERESSAPFLNRLIADIVIGALIVPLVIFLLELPFALLRSLFPSKGLVEAKDKGKPPARMRWKVEPREADAAVAEVARQLEAGSQNIVLPNAVFVG
jgi:hypothetical protein